MPETTPSEKIVNVPNTISFVRLLAVPVFWWLLVVEERVAASTILFIVVSWTDWVDGYLARRLNQVTKLGKALDPVADRLMIASAVVAGLVVDIVPLVIGVVLIVREVYMAAVTLILAAKRAGTLEVRYLGKAATFGVYGSIQAFYIAAVPFLEVVFEPIAWITAITGLTLYWWVAIQYTGDARKALATVESRDRLEES